MSKLKVGIIGCGRIAFGKHFPALETIDEIELVAFCDIIEENAQEAKEKYGTLNAKVYTDYKELLKDESIEAVHVLTPNRSHSFISVDALHAGKHVMCEKPMAINTEEAKKMVEAQKETGKLLTIGYQNRYRHDSAYLKAACNRGDLGDIYFAKAHALRRRAVPNWGVFLNEYEQGGGPLIDIGTHALDLTLWCMDNYKPKSVMGNVYKKLNDQEDSGNDFGPWKKEEFTVEDSAFGFITMEDGSTIILESSWALNTLDFDEAKTTLCGTKAGADMRDGLRFNSHDFGKLNVTKPQLFGEGVAFNVVDDNDKPECREARTFYDAILYNKPLTVTAEQAFVVTQILEGIYTSAKTGEAYKF